VTLRAFLADDEPKSLRKLRGLLEEIGGVEIVGEAREGTTAVEDVHRLEPDLVFLDIRMPGLSGLEVAEKLPQGTQVIFTTAYDRYAVAAFELHALDYLLKPFGVDRLRKALQRVPQTAEGDGWAVARARDALGDTNALTRLFVRERGHIVPLATSDIVRLEAGEEYVTLYTEERRYLVSVRLRDFEARLDPDRFLRISRADIVNLDHVRSLSRYDASRLQVELRDGTVLVASRSRSKDLRRMAV
jgi:two-component system LytT family response regulator